jgi:type IX secretion system PorP/SprF family membrane protein
MRNIIVSVFLIAISIVRAQAQEDPQFVHDMYNHVYTNPGSAGMTNGRICADIINRNTWIGFEGAPRTTLASVHTEVKKLKGGLGLSITDDRLGYYSDFRAKLAYSYHKQTALGTLGIGIDPGFMNRALEGAWQAPDGIDGDALIPQSPARKMFFDLGAGVFLKKTHKYYLGLSVSHIHNPKINYSDSAASFLRHHYYASAGYSLRLFNSPIELKPSVFIKSDGTKTQYSGNLTAQYNKKISVGVTYRNQDAIVGMIGIEAMPDLLVSYAYELSVSRLVTVNKGTHEIYVGYCLDLYKPPKNYKYKDVRYL